MDVYYFGFHTTPAKINLGDLVPYLGYQNENVIKKTLANTTQLAKTIVRFPMRRHFKARFPYLNRRRLDEVVSTDTVFSSHMDISGFHCCQVFYGLASHMINVYGMRSKAEFPEVYMDFIRREGAPTALRRDNAKEEKSYKVIGINQTYVIEDQFSQPYNQQQNPVERHAIRWLKDHAKILMDRTGAPPDVWLQALTHLADIRNVTSHDSLRGKTPIAERHGDTPDISAFLQFRFWEKKVYFRQEINFPNTNERALPCTVPLRCHRRLLLVCRMLF